MAERFLANVGRALIFQGDQFYGVANTLTENTFNFSASANEVRGGKSNPLLGRWFSDSTLNVTLTNATFRLDYLAMTLGTTIEQGGIALYESANGGEVVTTAGRIGLTKTPAAFEGQMIGWYKKVGTDIWEVATIKETSVGSGSYYMDVSNAQVNEVYCVKYQYNDPNVRLMTIPADFDPEELHIVIMCDEYNADINTDSSASVVGKLIVDIPRLGLDPNQELSLTATSSAPTQLTGTAFRYVETEGCQNDAIYGTMTEQIDGSVWQENVKALAVENADVEFTYTSEETNVTKATAIVYAVFNGMPSKKYANSNFTFTVESDTPNGYLIVDNNGNISIDDGLDADLTGVISVSLTDYPEVSPAYIYVNATYQA